jgi:RNA polymerase sigma-70 factor (ECF subfamily)
MPPACIAGDLAREGLAPGGAAVPRSGEEFGEFYLASYGRTVAMVAALVGNKHEAEDIAQEAYARALARWRLLRAYDLPEAWVRKVALRLAIDAARRQRRWVATLARLASLRQAPASEPADDLLHSPLGEALLSLPLIERQVLALHYVADLPVNAIAQECGLPPGTVKTRLAAGRRHLEERLTQHPEAVAG